MRKSLDMALIIARREFAAYFATPLATVFLVIFVALTGAFAFYVGSSSSAARRIWSSFFSYHPWLYLLLVPAIAMRLWAEERKTGTIELLMTLPVSPWEAILGKFLAAWAFVGVALRADVPDVDHRQLSGLARQRRHLRELPRLVPDRRRVSRHRLVHLGADQEPGHRLHRLGDVCFLLVMSGYELVLNAVRAFMPGDRRLGHPVAVVPQPLRGLHEGHHQPAGDRVLPR